MYTGFMPRRKKQVGEKYEGHQITLPPGLWEEIEKLTGKRGVSAFIQAAVEKDLRLIRMEQRLTKLEEKPDDA